MIKCEWEKCQCEAKVFINMDNETYAFCSDKHKDEFWEWICESDNY